MAQCERKSKQSGKRCRRAATPGKKVCASHGSKSKGPTSAAGKEASSRNAVKHWLYGSPKKFLSGLDAETRSLFEDQVAEICEAEGIDSSLDRALVESFVTLNLMEGEARGYLLERGVVTAEEWKEIPTKDEEGKTVYGPKTDTTGEEIIQPVVNRSLLGALGMLVKAKRELHAQLRAHTSKRGDMNPGGLELIVSKDLAEADKP